MTSLNARIGRIRWRGRRGMQELDSMLERYFEQHLADGDEALFTALERLLDCQDTELLDWLLGRSEPQDPQLKDIVAQIRGT